jgi:ferritin-like metal-binding protein YciE
MAGRTIDEQLTKYLTDAHSIEEQALAQLRRAPDMAGDAGLAAAFRDHLAETEGHERRVRELIEARDAGPSTVKDLAGRVSGVGFALFAKLQPDTLGKLAAHAYSYEHLELAAYRLLGKVAQRAGAADVTAAAREIEGQERAMAERIAARFDEGVDSSLSELSRDEVDEQLSKYLADAHAIERQSIELLKRGPKIAGSGALGGVLADHLEETREHERRLAARLEARGDSPSKLKDAALRLGALNWGMFFAAQPDTPAKLAGFAYAVEHLEIAAYELLARIAERAGDHETAELARAILAEERAAADRLAQQFDGAVDASLEAQEVELAG